MKGGGETEICAHTVPRDCIHVLWGSGEVMGDDLKRLRDELAALVGSDMEERDLEQLTKELETLCSERLRSTLERQSRTAGPTVGLGEAVHDLKVEFRIEAADAGSSKDQIPWKLAVEFFKQMLTQYGNASRRIFAFSGGLVQKRMVDELTGEGSRLSAEELENAGKIRYLSLSEMNWLDKRAANGPDFLVLSLARRFSSDCEMAPGIGWEAVEDNYRRRLEEVGVFFLSGGMLKGGSFLKEYLKMTGRWEEAQSSLRSAIGDLNGILLDAQGRITGDDSVRSFLAPLKCSPDLESLRRFMCEGRKVVLILNAGAMGSPLASK